MLLLDASSSHVEIRAYEVGNPFSHFPNFDDPTNLSRRVFDTMQPVELHLTRDAGFAISVVIRLLALPAFRVDK